MENINYTILRFGKEYQGILKLVGAVLSFLLALGTLIHLANISGFLGMSAYPTISEIFYEICLYLSVLSMLAGFIMIGIMLLTRPKHILTVVGIALVALGEFLGCMENFFYFIWQSGNFYSYYYSYPYIPMMFLSLFAAIAWAFPAAAGYLKNKDTFRNITLVFLILPAALFLLELIVGIAANVLYFTDFFYVLFEMVLLAVVGVLVLCGNDRSAMECIREMNKKNAEKRWEEAQRTQPGQTAHQAFEQSQGQQKATTQAAPQPQAAPAEGYMGIVSLVIFSIITLGIYVYIWIYKTTKFFDRRLNRQGSFSPGVEVVLCLFIPFYFIYWVYKQTKAAETAHKMAGNQGSDDLAIINILLCIFGLGIIAYALLQDQINKLCLGYTAPPNYERPQSVNTAGYNFDPKTGEPIRKAAETEYNFDPMTGEPIRKTAETGYNFDPMTGEPIRKEEAPVQNEIFEEVPIAEESPKEDPVISEEIPAEPIEEVPVEVFEEVPAEVFEEAPVEVFEEVPAEVFEEVPAEPVEEAPAEPAEEVSALTAEQEENIKMLERLRDAGILSAEEFETKKADLLK